VSAPDIPLDGLQEALGYRFRQVELLLSSLTHPSYLQQFPDAGPHYQRLEFLGDAILSSILADRLFHLYPNEREGLLSRSRSALVHGGKLVELSKQLGLDACIRMSEGEVQNGGRSKPSILEDVFEAVVGAIFLDSNWNRTRKFVLTCYGDLEGSLEVILNEDNPKGRLQELVQSVHGNDSVEYRVAEATGPAHRKHFTVEVFVNEALMGSGAGKSKKAAEVQAANQAVARWQDSEG
jgi:ribonuclease-3